MATAEDFWNKVQPSGLTAEQELVAFWQRMLDCPCKEKKRLRVRPAPALRNDDEEVLLLLL